MIKQIYVEEMKNDIQKPQHWISDYLTTIPVTELTKVAYEEITNLCRQSSMQLSPNINESNNNAKIDITIKRNMEKGVWEFSVISYNENGILQMCNDCNDKIHELSLFGQGTQHEECEKQTIFMRLRAGMVL